MSFDIANAGKTTAQRKAELELTAALSVNIAESVSRKLAMLIDGDNAQPELIEHMLAEAARYGTVTIRRIYGNWRTPQMAGWETTVRPYAIKPVHLSNYTTGKNATDSALIIDAMDILHSGMVQGFCIVSSDSDYTGLAIRIREHGVPVIGIGKASTPESFRAACQVFIFTENLAPQTEPIAAVHRKPIADMVKDANDAVADWRKAVKKAIEMSVQENDWALMSMIGINIRKINPSFDSRTYGRKKLRDLVGSDQEMFEMRQDATVEYVRLKTPALPE